MTVAVIMGSDSDWPVMEAAVTALSEFGVPSEVRVLSAHRTPRDMLDWAVFPGFWRMARSQWGNGVTEVLRSLSRARFLRSLQTLMPGLTDGDIAPGGSGVRAQAVDRTGKLLDDFHFVDSPGMVHVLNAPSPAATASLAIGRVVADRSMAS